MNIASKILVSGLGIALAACGTSTQSDVDKASSARAADVAKTREDARPKVDAANRDLAKAQEQGDAKVATAQATANREINEAAVKLSKEQAKASYDESVAKADGDQSVAVEKCRMLAADARTPCENNAHSVRDQTVETAKASLSLADKQPD